LSLTAGSRIGVYEVTASIGEGGMGQVFRATDTRLKRQVAIKILPPPLAADQNRISRFQREAEVLASLNHPNIAGIYGLEESDGISALVMELVEGEDLSLRIARGAIPLEEALPIAKQIADALDAAHEQGIVHRDLKPSNIKVRGDGTVKVLDFGLAKAIGGGANAAAAGPAAPLSMSPTMMSPAMSSVGVILGTAAYMAPEQARGRAVDKRADIWAFGVVLFEMVTGRRAFAGDEVSEVLASILARDVDLTDVPPPVRGLLKRCLEKDLRKRLRDIGDAMPLIDTGVAAASYGIAPASRGPRWPALVGWSAAGVMAVALAVALWLRPAAVVNVQQPVVRLQITRMVDVYNRTTAAFAVSPDGRMLAYYGPGADGPQTLLVRALATGEVRAVPRSANAVPLRDSLFWSPDSKQLVRGAAAGADVFDVTTGAVRRLCDCRYVGGSWGEDGTILVGGFGDRAGLARLTLGDATLAVVTTPDTGRGEQDTFPVFLPDGRRFLFTRTGRGGTIATFVGTLDAQPATKIADGSLRAIVPGSGDVSQVLGVDASGVAALPFDPNGGRVTGPTVLLAAGAVSLSASRNGVLATSTRGVRPQTIPTWFDRKGSPLGAIGEVAAYEAVALSADGRKLLTSESPTEAGNTANIWLRDLLTGARSRITFESGGTPVWSPDGRRLAFTSARDGAQLPFQRAANGTGSEAPLFPYRLTAFANDWSSDGRSVIVSTPSLGNVGNDLWVAPMTDTIGGTPVPYVVGPGLQQQAQFSPDGRFVAYGSDQGGTFDIYVQPFPNAGDGKWQVSTGGGVEPRWSRDGKELFYFSGQTLMAVPVTLQPTFATGTPVALFDAPIQPGYTSDSHRWQVASDGKRFLILANAGKDEGAPLDVVVNWTTLLKK
jgi:Tol biopolymer transport system component